MCRVECVGNHLDLVFVDAIGRLVDVVHVELNQALPAVLRRVQRALLLVFPEQTVGPGLQPPPDVRRQPLVRRVRAGGTREAGALQELDDVLRRVVVLPDHAAGEAGLRIGPLDVREEEVISRIAVDGRFQPVEVRALREDLHGAREEGGGASELGGGLVRGG